MTNLKSLIGSGRQITLAILPIALLVVFLSALYPGIFVLDIGPGGTILGIVLLLMGVPLWLTSGALVAINVPRGKLITSGPFRLMIHPVYTSMALLVLPGAGFLLKSWVWLIIGIALYFSSRILAKREEKVLEDKFSDEYRRYRSSVLLPWL
jgi:protein-S-isoprenylcysteine O-methyltransferase Ste14